MAKYLVPLTNGIYKSDSVRSIGKRNDSYYHQVSFEVDGIPTSGTIEIKARSPDSQVYEAIPDGVINLASPQTLLFQFNTNDFEFTVSGSDVSDGFINVNDQELKGVTP